MLFVAPVTASDAEQERVRSVPRRTAANRSMLERGRVRNAMTTLSTGRSRGQQVVIALLHSQMVLVRALVAVDAVFHGMTPVTSHRRNPCDP